MLENFEVFQTTNGGAVVSFTKNGTTFNRVAFEKMGKVQYVMLLINKEGKQIAIKQCTQTDANAMPFGATIKPKAPSVRWNNKELQHLVEEMMGWDLEETKGYKIVGEYLRSDKAIVFDLTKAIPIT